MITRQALNEKREAILELARNYGAHDVRLFGSVVRGDNTEASDVDILVRFDPDRAIMDHAALIGKLEDLLGVKVDVIDADGMRPRFREVVEKESLLL
jgi:uncharacterized protein